jgi:multidrug efflux system membrane fusion protein
VSALLALAEGGYGLQLVEGGGTRYIAVQTGLFADGRVEVSGSGLTAGMRVGVPS